ncbi:hypothetical protein Cgig2_006253 [Carnegiea gigantea]|uniref:Uncharacterized protein n=1 Tax=Carnegiea gigantea TaxID=171969 RepID=A0A9Q1JMW9_9CARY|nr:hypothetical protein Cgig2_006253 [Carnegiea gigantea]
MTHRSLLEDRPQFLQKEHNPEHTKPREDECSTEVIATITGRHHHVGLFEEAQGSSKGNRSSCTPYTGLWMTRGKPHGNDLAPTTVRGQDQGTEPGARECYLVSIRPMVERSSGRRPSDPPPLDKRPWVTHSPLVKTLAIRTLSSTNPEQLHPEAVDGREGIPLDEG